MNIFKNTGIILLDLINGVNKKALLIIILSLSFLVLELYISLYTSISGFITFTIFIILLPFILFILMVNLSISHRYFWLYIFNNVIMYIILAIYIVKTGSYTTTTKTTIFKAVSYITSDYIITNSNGSLFRKVDANTFNIYKTINCREIEFTDTFKVFKNINKDFNGRIDKQHTCLRKESK